jgi:hypothetical protein
MTDQATDPAAEIAAMKAVADALAKLDAEATARVVHWAADRFKVGGAKVSSGQGAPMKRLQPESADEVSFESVADLYAATSPKTEADKALVAGFWFQFCQGQAEFGSQTLNAELKNLGHGVSNITKALETLKAQNPALVMQLRKSGSTKQARKTFKLTGAGKRAVELLIRSE